MSCLMAVHDLKKKKYKKHHMFDTPFQKKNPIATNNLGRFMDRPPGSLQHQSLYLFIQRGVPCLKHSAYYLKAWKFQESTK